MKKILIIAYFMFFLQGCSFLPKENIFTATRKKEYAFVLKQYRTPNAREAFLGSIGYVINKKEPYGYQIQIPLKWDDKELGIQTILNLKFEASDQEAFDYFKLSLYDTLNLGTDESVSVSEKVNLVEVIISDRQFYIQKLNALSTEDPAFKEFLADPKIRIVTNIIKAYGYEIKNDLGFQAKVEASVFKNTIVKLDAKGSKGHKDQFQTDGGVIVGYVYSRLCWDTNKGNIRSLISDLPGQETCPPNSGLVYPGHEVGHGKAPVPFLKIP